jgi:hypothetical protein
MGSAELRLLARNSAHLVITGDVRDGFAGEIGAFCGGHWGGVIGKVMKATSAAT